MAAGNLEKGGFDEPHIWHKEKYLAGCSKSSSGEAAGELNPEAYPQGYVEDFDELRTKLEDFFSTRLNFHRLVDIMQRRFGDLACLDAAFCHNVVQV
jgi:hypothetical protein